LACSGHLLEEGDGEGRAIGAGDGGRGTREGGEKAVERAFWYLDGLTKQFAEQLVRKLRTERLRAQTILEFVQQLIAG
jgi:hypothetical protein